MNNRKIPSRVRTWLDSLPFGDLVDHQMAFLLQVMLLGLLAIIVIAAIVYLFLFSDRFSWQMIVIQGSIISLTIGLPLVLLRRGQFHIPVIIIVLFLSMVTYAILTSNLRSIAENLTFFTLAILLAGLRVGRRAPLFTIAASTGVVLLAALRKQDPAPRLDFLLYDPRNGRTR